ncbi:MAG: hypothetical protein PHE27_07025, partial [Alphaproteobacteria bacterium]|nr:hypothetical protein [Alphaproteobacteria bacterium]
LPTAPMTKLCLIGEPSLVSSSGNYWVWSCTEGTLTANCRLLNASAPACGRTNGTTISSKPTSALCSSGTTTVVNQSSGLWSWSCVSGSESVSCYARKCNCAICGTAAGVPSSSAPSSNLCAGGSPTAVTALSDGRWTWVCILDTTLAGAAHHDEHRCFAPIE